MPAAAAGPGTAARPCAATAAAPATAATKPTGQPVATAVRVQPCPLARRVEVHRGHPRPIPRRADSVPDAPVHAVAAARLSRAQYVVAMGICRSEPGHRSTRPRSIAVHLGSHHSRLIAQADIRRPVRAYLDAVEALGMADLGVAGRVLLARRSVA